MTPDFADVVVTSPSHATDVQAVCRTYAGIADVRRTDDVWSCSCGGAPACHHVRAVERELEVLS